jgi:murein L,D-transpeptidase YcbB/YkuD
MTERSIRYSLLILVAVVIAFAGRASAQVSFKDEILLRASIFQKDGKLTLGKQILYAADLTLRMYKLNDYQPLWSKESAQALYDAVDQLTLDGLNPKEYRFAATDPLLSKLGAGTLTATEQADLDFLLTESFGRAIYNLAFGKVDPVTLDPDINYTLTIDKEGVDQACLESIRRGKLAQALEDWLPQNKRYDWMKQALVRYREYQAAGGWAPIPGGPALKPGHIGPRAAHLRERLQASGDYPADAPPIDNPQRFDGPLADAVKHFQKRHGLDTDAIVGKATLAALNVSVEDRIDQIRVNLERQRWLMHEVYDEFLVVDIAGFNLVWVKGNEITWQEIVQVGKAYTKTPLFKDHIRYIVFNPTWTIPPGILRRSILPHLKKDPDYLNKKGFLLLTRDGDQVDPKSVDWASIKGFPYMVRQPPGPDNALGMVKFIFPNPHYVFLHDTNHRELFDRAARTFSSGCVRVRNPFTLAERLLADQPDWTRERIDRVIASGKTTTVNLKIPMRIIIAYGTVVAREEGQVSFREDVYKRDVPVLKALDGGFKLRKQDR